MRTGRRTALATAIAVVAGVLALWHGGCDDGGNGEHETACSNGRDDDGDLLTDCADPDCRVFAVCASDGDADVDSDGDGDADVDGDADTDADGETCAAQCEESPLYDRCEVGDCGQTGAARDCCVAAETTCRAELTAGEVASDLVVDYRGFYSNDFMCTFALLESDLVWTLVRRGASCDVGYLRVDIEAPLEAVTLDEDYDLCSNFDGAAAGLRVTLSVFVDPEGGDPELVTYHNGACAEPGRLRFEALGGETGEPYAFVAEGELAETDGAGDPTGRVIDLAIDSSGRVEVLAPR